MDLSVTIGGKLLKNPVGVASGTFGYGSEYEELINLNDIGAIFTKAVTPLPRTGNPIPRLAETPAGILNSIGLANVGLESFIGEKIPAMKSIPCSIVVNVAGSTNGDYLSTVEALNDFEEIWGFEINLSCPNVKHGCLAFGTSPANVEDLTRQLRAISSKPLIIKLTPNVTDITAIAKAAEAGGADGISCINTLLGMAIDIHKKKPVIPSGTAGLSGPAIRPVGIAAVYRVSRAVSIPVFGIGGIMDPQDAIEYLLAGASAVQIGTGNFVDPSTCSRVLRGIREYMEQNNLNTIADFHQFLPR